jgi:hypothetical protein
MHPEETAGAPARLFAVSVSIEYPPMRISITMFYGFDTEDKNSVDKTHFDHFIRMASELGFDLINYDGLAAWMDNHAPLPNHPIMFDFDQSMKSMRHGADDVPRNYGYRGNLFVNTRPLEEMYSNHLLLEYE